jgi:hypothetical protein
MGHNGKPSPPVGIFDTYIFFLFLPCSVRFELFASYQLQHNPENLGKPKKTEVLALFCNSLFLVPTIPNSNFFFYWYMWLFPLLRVNNLWANRISQICLPTVVYLDYSTVASDVPLLAFLKILFIFFIYGSWNNPIKYTSIIGKLSKLLQIFISRVISTVCPRIDATRGIIEEKFLNSNFIFGD